MLVKVCDAFISNDFYEEFDVMKVHNPQVGFPTTTAIVNCDTYQPNFPGIINNMNVLFKQVC